MFILRELEKRWLLNKEATTPMIPRCTTTSSNCIVWLEHIPCSPDSMLWLPATLIYVFCKRKEFPMNASHVDLNANDSCSQKDSGRYLSSTLQVFLVFESDKYKTAQVYGTLFTERWLLPSDTHPTYREADPLGPECVSSPFPLPPAFFIF